MVLIILQSLELSVLWFAFPFTDSFQNDSISVAMIYRPMSAGTSMFSFSLRSIAIFFNDFGAGVVVN